MLLVVFRSICFLADDRQRNDVMKKTSLVDLDAKNNLNTILLTLIFVF